MDAGDRRLAASSTFILLIACKYPALIVCIVTSFIYPSGQHFIQKLLVTDYQGKSTPLKSLSSGCLLFQALKCVKL